MFDYKSSFIKKKLHEIKDLPETLEPYCKKDYYNIPLYLALGDNFYILYILKKYSEYCNKQFNYIIKEAFLPKLFGIETYSVFDINSYVRNKLNIKNNKVLNKSDILFRTRLLEYYLIYHSLEKNININNPFVFEWFKNFYYINPIEFKNSVIKTFFDFLGIDLAPQRIIKEDVKYPLINFSLPCDVEKIVLLIPESYSLWQFILNKVIWEEISRNLIKKGYTVIENIINKENHIEGAIDLDLTPEQLIALGANCHSVFSIRNGICDILACTGSKLNVFTPYVITKIWPCLNFKLNFNLDEYPNEYIYSKNIKPKVMFEGIDLFKNVKQSWLKSKN